MCLSNCIWMTFIIFEWHSWYWTLLYIQTEAHVVVCKGCETNQSKHWTHQLTILVTSLIDIAGCRSSIEGIWGIFWSRLSPVMARLDSCDWSIKLNNKLKLILVIDWSIYLLEWMLFWESLESVGAIVCISTFWSQNTFWIEKGGWAQTCGQGSKRSLDMTPVY